MPDMELRPKALWLSPGPEGGFTRQLGHDLATAYLPSVVELVWGEDVAGNVHLAYVPQDVDNENTTDITIVIRPLYRQHRAEQLGRFLHELDGMLREVCPELAEGLGIELPSLSYEVNFKFGGGRHRVSFGKELVEPWFSEVPEVTERTKSGSAQLDFESLREETDRARDRLEELKREAERLKDELRELSEEDGQDGPEDPNEG